jgi:hypothetical protein
LTGHHSQLAARRFIIERFCRSRWCLWLDIDELFDYPFSDRLPLKGVIQYLESHGYTVVVGQMLDLFADAPLGEPASPAPRSLSEFVTQYPYYDIASIDQFDYATFDGYRHHHNVVSNARIKFHMGGIRRAAFGTNQWLTKHPLIFLDGRLRPATHQHWVTHATCADFSCVLYHYKFLPDSHARNRRAYESGFGSTHDYRQLVAEYDRSPGMTLKRASSRRRGDVMNLVDERFLVTSDAYAAWARDSRRTHAD